MAIWLRTIAKYVPYYIIGILAAILLTPVSATLMGVTLWPYFIVLPGVSFVFFYTLAPAYVLGATPIYWLIYAGGLVTLCAGLSTFTSPMRELRRFRPALIGLPLGFIGALGVFYTAAASI